MREVRNFRERRTRESKITRRARLGREARDEIFGAPLATRVLRDSNASILLARSSLAEIPD